MPYVLCVESSEPHGYSDRSCGFAFPVSICSQRSSSFAIRFSAGTYGAPAMCRSIEKIRVPPSNPCGRPRNRFGTARPVVIFPEGGTSRDGSIKPFKGGGFMLATKSNAQVVPVTIRGSRPVLVPKTYHVRGGNVEVIIGKPIASDGASASELANRVREEIVRRSTHGKTLDRNSYSISREV